MHSEYKVVEIFLLVAPTENSSPDLLIDALINSRFVKASQAANSPSLSRSVIDRMGKNKNGIGRRQTVASAIDIQGR